MYPFCSPWIFSSNTSPSSSSSSSSTSSSLPSSPASTSIWTHLLFAVLIILVYTSSASEACFIRNCPKGGKRSLGEEAIARRQCMTCGPLNAGQCVGPSICCSSHFGCYFGTPETDVCQKENESVEPCYVIGDVCGSHNGGKCVANGVCCDSDSCALNQRCRQPVAGDDTVEERGQILQLIKRLLRAKSFK